MHQLSDGISDIMNHEVDFQRACLHSRINLKKAQLSTNRVCIMASFGFIVTFMKQNVNVLSNPWGSHWINAGGLGNIQA